MDRPDGTRDLIAVVVTVDGRRVQVRLDDRHDAPRSLLARIRLLYRDLLALLTR